MNRRIGMAASVANAVFVVGFGAAMIVGVDFGSYFTSMFIALSFVVMMSAFCIYARADAKLAGFAAVTFAIMYATTNCIVYFTQITTVQAGGISEQAARLIDFKRFGLFFNLDMLGYALMALATFFAGLTIEIKSKSDKWLKLLLMIHGIFFVSCLALPLLGIFDPNMQGGDSVGTYILTFWCVYFVPIGVLSFIYFRTKEIK